jgi:hypothetical protein
MSSPQEMIKGLKNSASYKEWAKEYKNAYLSHFFCPINNKLEEMGSWEIGFYDPNKDKITIFQANGEEFQRKQEDNVFKEKASKVEKLELFEKMITLDKAKKVFGDNFPALFPNEVCGNGFLILQCLNGNTQWNFTLISRSLKFLNIKINSVTAEIDSHQAVELVSK